MRRFLGLVALFLAVQVGVAIALPRLHRMPEYVVQVSNPPAWVPLYGVHDYVKVTNTMPRTLRLSCRVVGRADGSGFFPPGRYGDTERFLLRPFATHDWMELGIRITRIDCK